MSQVSIFFVPLIDGTGAQEEMNSFLRGHRAINIEKAFAGNGWAFCVEWIEGGVSKGVEWRQKRIDYREVLSSEEFERFAILRERRKAIANEDGVPPYMVMTDAQMAEASKAEVLDESVLRKIDGFGDARIGKYARRILNGETK